MNLYQAAGALSVLLTFVSFAPYVIGIHKGMTKPHFFSWVIWSISTTVVFFAQVVSDGGPGAWSTGMSGAITMYVTWLAWSRYRDIHITRADRVFLWSALLSLPLWYFTSDPLWAVVILTTIDVLGFGPTLRKLHTHPYEESIVFYFFFTVRSALSIVALESRTLTTVLFPAAMVVACLIVVIALWWRRRVFARQSEA
jgi:hypothetical protein